MEQNSHCFQKHVPNYFNLQSFRKTFSCHKHKRKACFRKEMKNFQLCHFCIMFLLCKFFPKIFAFLPIFLQLLHVPRWKCIIFLKFANWMYLMEKRKIITLILCIRNSLCGKKKFPQPIWPLYAHVNCFQIFW